VGVEPTYNGFADRPVDSAKPKSTKGLRIATPFFATPLPCDTRQTDPELAAVIDAWDRLPEAVRAGIVAMVMAARR
jgi:hypothetical protein